MVDKVITASRSVLRRPAVLFPAAALATLLWSYWTTLEALVQTWLSNDHYSHGFLVPVFALVLLGLRWPAFRGSAFAPSLWGIPVLAAGVAMRLAGTHYYYIWLDPISLLPCLFGLVVLCEGWPAVRWSWPALAFLVFMMPLPYRLDIAMARPLRQMGTLASTYVLQTLGFPALAEGNTILLNDAQIPIIEGCSGLSMLLAFFALTTGMALLTRRPLWEKTFVVLCAVPIALVTNIARITVQAMITDLAGDNTGDFFHTYSFLFMMSVALALLGFVSWLLAWLLVAKARQRSAPLALALPKAAGAAAAARRPRQDPASAYSPTVQEPAAVSRCP
jgi:exosortase